MKKLIYLLCIFLSAACNQNNKEKQVTKGMAAPVTTQATLNGIPMPDAKDMVDAFRKNRKSTSTMTAINFTEKFIDDALTILKNENGDGMRVYFAIKDGKNTVVILSTKYAGKSNIDSTHDQHQDYFGKSSGEKSIDEHDNRKTGLYAGTICPALDNCTRDVSYVSCSDAQVWAINFNKGQEMETNAVWYGVELLKKLKAQLVATKNALNKEVSIRMYFIKPEVKKNGLVFFVTAKNSNGVFEDQYQCYNKIYGWEKSGIKRRGDDRGEECPVYCEKTIWP